MDLDMSEQAAFANDREYGLTKREYFAALIMAGMMASPQSIGREEAAHIAVNQADALIDMLGASK